MSDTKTRPQYANFSTELKKLLDFSRKNHCLLTKGFNNDESAMVFVFTEQLPFGPFQTEIKLNKDLFKQLLTEEKLANYVIKEFAKRAGLL